MGFPFVLGWGAELKASKATKYNWAMTWGSASEVHHKITHKLNDNIKVKHHSHLFSKEGNSGIDHVDFGLEFSYKL